MSTGIGDRTGHSNAITDASTVCNRREFLFKAGVGVVGLAAVSAAVGLSPIVARAAVPMNMAAMNMAPGMSEAGMQDTTGQKPKVEAGVVDMEVGEFYKPVRKAAKANPVVQMSSKQIEEFERNLACPCPCTLDVFTCRTTDFSCGNSPAVHRDIQRLVAGGYSANEIMDAMLGVYGNTILMAPPKSGFNLIGWYAPFAALGTGALVIGAMLKKWRRNSDRAAAVAVSNASMTLPDVGATDEEMARLQKALREEGVR